MKVLKICLITFLAVSCIVCAFLLFHEFNISKKLPNSYITFEVIGDNDFFSNHKSDMSYNSYKICITTNGEKDFGDTSLKSSINVIKTLTKSNKQIEVDFKITSGVDFWIEIESDNYNSKKEEYKCTSFVTEINMFFDNLNDWDDNGYDLSKNGYYNILYLVPCEHYSTCIKDKFPSQVDYHTIQTDGSKNDFYVGISNTEILEINLTTCKITPLAIGNCTITFTAKDNSNYSKNFYFSIKKVMPTKVDNLPNTVNIDLSTSNNYSLQNLSVYPSYSNKDDLIFQVKSLNNSLNVINYNIVSSKEGNEVLQILSGNQILKEINVNTIRSLAPYFSISLFEDYDNKITILNNEITLNLADFDTSLITIAILITLNNVQSTTQNFEIKSYSDNDSCIQGDIGYILEQSGISLTVKKTGYIEIKIINSNFNIDDYIIKINIVNN